MLTITEESRFWPNLAQVLLTESFLEETEALKMAQMHRERARA